MTPDFTTILSQARLFTASDGRAFARLPRPCLGGGFLYLPVRSSAFREWFFLESLAQLDTVPSAHAWSALCRRLEAEATRDPNNTGLLLYRRVGRHRDAPILIDLANARGDAVAISAGGYHLQPAEKRVPFESAPIAQALPAPLPAPDPSSDPPFIPTPRT